MRKIHNKKVLSIIAIIELMISIILIGMPNIIFT